MKQKDCERKIKKKFDQHTPYYDYLYQVHQCVITQKEFEKEGIRQK